MTDPVQRAKDITQPPAAVDEVVAWHIQHKDGLVALRQPDSVDWEMREQAEADGLIFRPLVFGDKEAAAAVEAKDAEIEALKAEAAAQRTRADAMAGEAIKHEARADQAAAVYGLAARLVDELDALVSESDGVSGLHLNGNLAPWEELLPGGRFECLSSLDELREALTAQQQEPTT